jgi:hypothetical protein
MNRLYSICICLITFLAIASHATGQTWTALGPAGGDFGRVFVAPSQPTTLFSFPGRDNGGLFKSTNSGDSWQSISTSMTAASCDIHVNDLAIHPTQPATVFVATQALGVCKTTDGGTTWTQLISGLPNDANSFQRPIKSIAINPQTPTQLFAGTEAGIYVSVNSGSTWTLSGTSTSSMGFIAFAPSAPNTAYASATTGVFKTTDGGTTWASASTGLPSTLEDGLLTVSPTSPNTVFLVVENNVYKTTNGGASWASSTSGAAGAFFYGNVSIDPTNANTMFLTAVGSCGLCKSTDGGATWAAVNPTGLPSGFGATNVIETTTIDPTSPAKMYGGTPFGAYRSTNSGVTWTAISTGLNGQSIGSMGLGGDSPASVFIGTGSASNDGSDVYRLAGGALPFTNLGNVVSDGRLTDVVVDPTNASIIYTVGGKSNNQNCAQVYKSTNGGAAWTAINPSTVPAQLCAGPLVMDPSTPATLYLGVRSNTGGTQSAVVYKTTNGGSSWTSASTGLSFSFQRLAISRKTPAVLYGSSGSTVYKTTNGAGNWTQAGSGLPSGNNSGNSAGRLAIDPTDDNVVYAATTSGVSGTTNGGTSWIAKRGGWPTIHGTFYGAGSIAVDPSTPTTLYAGPSTPSPAPVDSFGDTRGLGTGLYKSTDSGANWTSATDVLAGVNVSNVLFDGTRIYAATNNGVFKFAVTTTPTVTLDRTALSFAAVGTPTAFSSQTGPQIVRLRQAGGTATWTATSGKAWLTVTPASGSGSATLTIAVKPDSSAPASGSATGTITIALTGASNTAGPITVTLTVVPTTAAPSPAFGVFDTPAGDATVLAGSIAVTGWTLDNIGVRRVEIWRDLQAGETTPPNPGGPGDPRTGKVLITDNVLFVDGARPDVETLNPTTPMNYRAGWGYLLLTWGLWNQGNGTYKLYAYAFDLEGNFSTIGSKTIVVSNNTATKPFGSIDNPSIGGDPSVPPQYTNLGWGLTPKVNGAATCKIQSNGVQVSIDSGPLQPVVYGDARPDISGAFVGFSNSAAAGGHYAIDWSTLANGSHTIGWLITDDCSRADGVGSRFFNISTGTNLRAAETAFAVAEPPSLMAASRASETESQDAITVARGYGELPEILDPAVTGSRTVEMKLGERIEIRVSRGFESAYQLGPNGQRRALPAGSTWDADSQTFYWQPAPGFLGRFRLVFSNGSERISVRVVILPQ